jgi:hypothetical protein
MQATFATTRTVTLTDLEWSSATVAILCLAIDERLKGNSETASHYMDVYKTLKLALA